MNHYRLSLNSMRFYWRTQAGITLGIVVSTAVLVGALAVGDSVRYSLRQMALARVGRIQFAMAPSGRYFRSKLAENLQGKLGIAVAPILMLRGSATGDAGTARANNVQVIGVDDRFWALSPSASAIRRDNLPLVAVNQRLSTQLALATGDGMLIRLERPSLLPRDSSMATTTNASTALRLDVSAVLNDKQFGRFGLQSSQVPPYSVFVPISLLQRELGMEGKANTLLIGGGEQERISAAQLDRALQTAWKLEDANLQIHALPRTETLELRTDRVFFDPPVAAAALQAAPGATGILTYFVNELRHGEHATPYSLVAAMGEPVVPANLMDDEIIINAWLADDLKASSGDLLDVTFYVDASMRRLEERVASFRVRSVLPMQGDALDLDLMPDFPGISGAVNCRDWDPGIPVDLNRIRPKDEVYWEAYRGTPKAFINLQAGQKLWENRFGNLTAVRYPGKSATQSDAVASRLMSSLAPGQLGMSFRPVRDEALRAGEQSLDFGQLFLGLSFFLILSALLLTNLLFVFGMERRQAEVGTLLAVGFRPRDVRRLFLLEGAALACVGGVVGAWVGLAYTRLMIYLLNSFWRSAVAEASLSYHASAATVIAGGCASVAIGLLSLWITLRKQAMAAPRQLLTRSLASASLVDHTAGHRRARWIAAACGLLAVAVPAFTGQSSGHETAGAFFGAGLLLLVSFLSICDSLLSPTGGAVDSLRVRNNVARLTIGAMAWRNASRRRGRSLATVGLLSCASFLLISVGANRRDPGHDARKRSAGTGGFALIGQSTLPIYEDLNSPGAIEALGLDTDTLQGVSVVPGRIHEGEDASCLNLNRAQVPRLIGIAPALLGDRGSFTFVKTLKPEKRLSPWALLDADGPTNTVPTIGDQSTVVWGLGKSVGDSIRYTDERGNAFQLQIVGIIANSILQGNLLISEDRFSTCFPSESGHRLFLIDTPKQATSTVSHEFSHALEDFGVEITPAARRLSEFSAVENAYLNIFQALGGLGLLLGSVGIGICVMRNVLDRRGELALLRAVGFRTSTICRLIMLEHLSLLALGVISGTLASLIAIYPSLRTSGAEVPYVLLSLTMLAVLLNGCLWTWGATTISVREPMMDALQSE
ncbi:MAG: hypothetical protein AUJ92_10135 [Armatimonadetes bacterium CG2_30_59_28]|nr:MAG: hypothetical protein AUJ92_10135 [Armatimonadetes bacterium CG2_30_59_28]PIU62539.1 MAG: hypothetical protein COS85_18220 [Armatimonadetes bacterium CG07_land_8_20_14_0_80_59_28]